jgi:hypothetical protein
MSYCPKEDSLWLSRSATITQQHDNFASFHSLEWPHRAPPMAANQGNLLPKRYFGKQRPLLVGFLKVYCPQQDERWFMFMSYERLKLGNFGIFIFTSI